MKNALRRLISSPWFELPLRLVLAAAFLYAVPHKILNPADFARIIYGYQILPAEAVNAAAILMPWFELVTGLSLLLGVYPRTGALFADAMLLIFILAISFNLLRGLEFDCGCFSIGKAGHVSDAKALLARDILLFAAGLPVMLFKGERKFCAFKEKSK